MHANNAKSVKEKKRSFRMETLLDEAPAKFIIRKPILVITKMTPKAESFRRKKKQRSEVKVTQSGREIHQSRRGFSNTSLISFEHLLSDFKGRCFLVVRSFDEAVSAVR